jgi:hypothetical protein
MPFGCCAPRGLPTGFKRIRHIGLLAPAHKASQLALACAALDAPVPDPAVIESVEAFMQRVARIEWRACPHCGAGHFVVTGPVAQLRAPGGVVAGAAVRPLSVFARRPLSHASAFDRRQGGGRAGDDRGRYPAHDTWPNRIADAMRHAFRRPSVSIAITSRHAIHLIATLPGIQSP